MVVAGSRPPSFVVGSGTALLLRRRNLGIAGELAVDTRHALDLALGRKALVEAFHPESPRLLGPRREALFPAFDPPVGGLRVFAGEIGANAQPRLPRDSARDH